MIGLPVRKVSHNKATKSHFVYLPKQWFDKQTEAGWNGKKVNITQSSRLIVKPFPSEKQSLIVTKTPLRLPLCGGGTDLPEYYTKHDGGFWVSVAISNYVHVIVKERFEKKSKFVYSETQYVDEPSQFTHPILRAVLTKYDVVEHVELVSLADLPSGVGLGSSGAFTVGLLNAVNLFLRQKKSASQLAEEAYEIERYTLGRQIGKQDQYACAFGGLNSYTVDKTGKVSVEKLKTGNDFEKWLLLFYVNQRCVPAWKAANAMSDRDRHETAKVGKQAYTALLNNDFAKYGELLGSHWKLKRKYQPPIFDQLINTAKSHGALSGKLCGAGNGGVVLLVCPPECQLSVVESLRMVARQIRFRFEPFGTEVY